MVCAAPFSRARIGFSREVPELLAARASTS
jgi:hypothetical protein